MYFRGNFFTLNVQRLGSKSMSLEHTFCESESDSFPLVDGTPDNEHSLEVHIIQ